MFDACLPLGPVVTSNETFCPSFRDLKPGMVPGTVRANGGPASVEFAGGVHLPMPLNATGVDGQNVLYGMREMYESGELQQLLAKQAA